MYTFRFQQNKESISVSIEPGEDAEYLVTVTLEGKPDSRVMIHADPHYVREGRFAFTSPTGNLLLTWGVEGRYYNNRRIRVDVNTGALTYEIWTYVPEPDLTGYVVLLRHDLKANPSPSYKLYKSKGELKTKLL